MPPMAVDSGAGVAKPKKAASAYFLYTSSVRPGLIEESRKANCGKVKMPEVAKKMSEMWSKLGESEKAKWEEQAKEGKEKQAVEMKAYKEASDPLSALKEKHADLIPKKPVTAFWIFSQDASERSKAEKALTDAGEDASHKKITIKIGEIWKALSESEKEPWNEKLKKATAEYEEKKKIWEATPEFVEFSKLEKEQKEAKAKEKAEQKEAAKEEKAKEKAEQKEQKAKEKAEMKEAAKEEKKAAKSSPKKREKRESEAGDSGSSPPAKKAKVEKSAKVGKKNSKPAPPEIDPDVLKKAQDLNLEAGLRNLMIRPEIMVKDFPQTKLLKELEKAEGLVNKAKYALLGGA